MREHEMLYLDLSTEKFDPSGIAIDVYESLAEVPNRVDRYTEPIHTHNHYELVLILKGACQHIYRACENTIIRGDIVLIPPHMPHGYRFQETIAMANLQFHTELMDEAWESLLHSMDSGALQHAARMSRGLAALDALGREERHTSDLNAQGIIRLHATECDRVEGYMRELAEEHRLRKYGYERFERSLLEQILITVKRVQLRQFERAEKPVTAASWKETMIEDVLSRIDRSPADDFDFDAIAAERHITQTYFRRLFKATTGISPIEYLNRTRVLRALELMQTSDVTVAEAASQVGIYDANYFSRVFKKYLGYSPRYFKQILADS